MESEKEELQSYKLKIDKIFNDSQISKLNEICELTNKFIDDLEKIDSSKAIICFGCKKPLTKREARNGNCCDSCWGDE